MRRKIIFFIVSFFSFLQDGMINEKRAAFIYFTKT